ncbi:MAG: SRPBCC family protein [Sphingobacterium sp.]
MMMIQKNEITVEAKVNAPVEKVWHVWNNPDDIMQWNSADPNWHTPSSENDLRVGGKFKNRMEAKDGSFGFDFEGTYTKVDLNKEISYTMSDGRKATTVFDQSNGTTLIQTKFDAEDQNDLSFQKQGWQAILDSFVQYIESNN